MMPWKTLPVLMLWALASNPVLAQTSHGPNAGSSADVQRGRRMSEDVEIMRRLLLRKLGAIPNAAPFVPLYNLYDPNLPNTGMMGGGFGGGMTGLGGALGGGAGMMGGSPGMGGVIGGGNLGIIGGVGGSPGGGYITGSGGGMGGARMVYSQANIVSEGAYLRGYGVVFAVTLPFSPKDADGKPRKPAVKISDWDQIQLQVRGEKLPKAKPQPGQVRPGRAVVADIVLQALAENGKHFSLLKPEEVVTVLVSFRYRKQGKLTGSGRGGSSSGTSGGSSSGSSSSGTGSGGGAGSASEGSPGFGGRGAGGRSGGNRNTKPSSAGDYELLADLLLKQSKAPEAAEALKKAIEMDNGVANRVRLYHKLAQAYLASDQDAEAQRALQILIKLRKKAPAPQSGGSDGGASSPVPPAPAPQLIISAPKALLDRVGAGRMTLEEFHQAASIEVRGGGKTP